MSTNKYLAATIREISFCEWSMRDGVKLFLRSDAVLAALGAKAARRPVKVTLQRALIPNNTTHRSATIQRVRIASTREGKITAIAHESASGDLPNGKPENAATQTASLYAGEHRMTANRAMS
jgi:xanthine dehydrogenase YagR molybdenum-binding subunit